LSEKRKIPAGRIRLCFLIKLLKTLKKKKRINVNIVQIGRIKNLIMALKYDFENRNASCNKSFFFLNHRLFYEV